MNNEKLIQEFLKTRYTKSTFILKVIEDCVVPTQKASGFRGGIGEMLLRKHCINNRECDHCGFESECLVQRTMYSKFSKNPPSINAGESIGYVIECNDYRTELRAGDEIKLTVTLFGKTIVYFSQYLYAIADLGMCGFGKEKAKFVISQVINTFGEDILNGNNIFMSRYKVNTLSEYVEYRKRKSPEVISSNSLVFQSPVTIKYRGEKLDRFDADALIQSTIRRLYILGCYEENEVDDYRQLSFDTPFILGQSVSSVSVRRYSFRKESAMWMKGIKGSVEVDHIPEELIDLFLAAEVTHIGSNTHFGFGKIKVI